MVFLLLPFEDSAGAGTSPGLPDLGAMQRTFGHRVLLAHQHSCCSIRPPGALAISEPAGKMVRRTGCCRLELECYDVFLHK